MAASLVHKSESALLSLSQYLTDEHQFGGGMTGGILTWDPSTAPLNWSWKASLGLNEATPATAGTIATTLGANNVTGIRLKRFTDVGPTGKFIDFQTAAGASPFVIDIEGSLRQATINPTQSVTSEVFAYPGSLSGPYTADFKTTWQTGASVLGSTLQAQAIVESTAPGSGSAGGLVGGVLNKKLNADVFGVLGLVNNDVGLTTPTGAALWGIIRGQQGAGGTVDAIRAYAENDLATTGNTTSGSAVVTNIPSTSAMRAGQGITGSGIPVHTTILTVDSSSQVTMSANATATATGVTIHVAAHPRSGIEVSGTTAANVFEHGIYVRNAWKYGIRIGDAGNIDPSIAALAVTPNAGGTSFSVTMAGAISGASLAVTGAISGAGMTVTGLAGAALVMNFDTGDATHDTGFRLKKGGTSKWYITNSHGGSDRLYVLDGTDGNGVYLAQGATSWTANSDQRGKERVETIRDALSAVLAMRGVEYNFAGNRRREYGVIAQEVYPYAPRLVNTDDGERWGVHYDRFAPIFIEAFKDVDLTIASLNVEIGRLTTRLADLESQRS